MPKRLPAVELYQPAPVKLSPRRTFEVVITGATPGGCAAAIAAARAGRTVALVEPSSHVGGMLTGGLSRTDFGTLYSRGGLFDEFLMRVHAHYLQTYGPGSPQLRDCREGYYFEPKVAHSVLWQLLDECRAQRVGGIHLFLRHELAGVVKAGNRMTSLLVRDADRLTRRELKAPIFIDATYEGDLAALAGADFRLGREDKSEFNERFAGEIIWDTRPYRIVGGSGRGDRRIQAYCYRLCLTRRPDLRVPIEQPSSYDRARYATIVPDVMSGWHKDWFTVMSILPLPNGKFDVNNHPKGVPSTDLIEGANQYPEADYRKRDIIAQAHKDHILGLMWFLQNDEALPENFRAAGREWGLCRDEFEASGYFPPQLYVREARRIVGRHLMTEHDLMTADQTERGARGMRPPIHADAIAVGDYPTDSHATTPVDPQNPRLVEGFYFTPVNPYQIPYRALLPPRVERLIVAVPLSSTHVAYGTLRMEPVWMAVGAAAGMAADEALLRKTVPSRIDLTALQLRLARSSQVLTVFTDLPRAHPQFEALQWAGTRGFFPTYEARPDQLCTEREAAEWIMLLARAKRSRSGILPDSPPSVGINPADSDEPLTSEKLRSWLSDARRRLGSKSAKLPSSLRTGYPTRAEACEALLQWWRTL